MKKAVGIMALGMGMGAGAVIMYDRYKNDIAKVVSNGAKEFSKTVTNASKKMNDSK